MLSNLPVITKLQGLDSLDSVTIKVATQVAICNHQKCQAPNSLGPNVPNQI
jgi:hypothetical protein